MSEYKYRHSWPKENLYADCYAHQVQSFRYHWHRDSFELNILLYGRQHFFQGNDIYELEENDVILVNPNVGHASYSDPEGTLAFVLHFSSSVLKQFMNKSSTLSINDCLSNAKTRNDPAYQKVRMYAAQTMYYLSRPGQFSDYLAKASLEMLIGTLCTMFDAEAVPSSLEADPETQKAIDTVISYLEENCTKKITLEEIAALTGYNRTYISTLFHQTVGIKFYDYVIRLRLQKAIHDLVTTDRSLTDIALYNGFSDLKSFNTRFRDMLKILPSEYRARTRMSSISQNYYEIVAIPADDPLIEKKLKEYMAL